MDTGTNYHQQAMNGMPQSYAAATNSSNHPNTAYVNQNHYSNTFSQQPFNNSSYSYSNHYQQSNLLNQAQQLNYPQTSNYFMHQPSNLHQHQQSNHIPISNQNQPVTNQNQQTLTTHSDTTNKIPSFFDEKKSYHTLRFRSLKKFDDRFMDYFVLDDHIRTLKPDTSIVSAVINKFGILVIITDKITDAENLINWPENAFDHGIEYIRKTPKYYLALHRVSTHLNKKSTRALEEVKNKYDIDGLLRMVKRSTNTRTELVKAFTSNKSKYEQIIHAGGITLGSTLIRVSKWRFGVKPNQCHNCQKFGHSKEWCPLKNPVCLRCKQDHSHRECQVTDESQFVCANCDGNHSAVSRNCPKMIEEMKKKRKNKTKK